MHAKNNHAVLGKIIVKTLKYELNYDHSLKIANPHSSLDAIHYIPNHLSYTLYTQHLLDVL